MYDATDPRASLRTVAAGSDSPTGAAGAFGDHSCVHFLEDPACETVAGSRRCYARGQNFLVCHAQTEPGSEAVLAWPGRPDEYVVLAVDRSCRFRVMHEGREYRIPGHSIAFVPAGDSCVTVDGGQRIVFLFSSRDESLCAKAANAAAYRVRHARVAELLPWPHAKDGPRVRWYDLDVPDVPGRFGRIWRCSTFMVNVILENQPRDVARLSPHHHDSFEQGSLLLAGAMTHHLRWPWTTDMRQWKPDLHLDCRSPSLTVIPPPAIHTSNATDPGGALLVDIFCPPRMDFSLKPGWVLNEAEYPMPGRASTQETKA
ncbi:MAG: hypothetical protein AB7G13_01185 [Lautropia sp.]